MAYGFDRSRFHENKRAVPDKELGPLIKTSMNRCINCTRCVRFAEEIAGTPVLGQLHRGEEAEITTFIGDLVKTELSGNLVDVCPVGALLSKPYSFKARPWERTKTETIDGHDALGCNIRVDVRGREVMRVLPRLHEDINEEWIDDRTRYSYDGLNKGRIDRPYIREEKSGKLKEATWEQAFSFIASRLKGLNGAEIAGLVGDLADVESIVALKDLLTNLGSPNMDCRTDGSTFDPSHRAGYLFNSTIAGIDQADAVLLIGTNPRHDASILNARILRNVNDRGLKVGVIGDKIDLNYSYQHFGNSFDDLEKLMKNPPFEAKNPMWIIGANVFEGETGAATHQKLYGMAQGLRSEGWNGFNVLHTAASRVGALDVGFVPQKSGKAFKDIVTGTKDGKIKALFMLGADEFDARAEIGWKTFVIYQGHHGDAGAARADVILPGAAYTEKDGIYVNTEGRPQAAKRASFPPGDAREDWAIIRALSTRLEQTLPYDTHFQLRERIFKEWPHLGEFDMITPATPESRTPPKEATTKFGPFRSKPQSYYLKNAICRASDTMHKCVEEFLPQQLEAAE
jgi:NADH-quinone oxidoreductase subunit G